MKDYWFKSSIFEVEPGEDNETNPRCYGKQPANWLKEKFKELGYKVEDVIPEDWGWCVICSREPYMLWVGCRSLVDYDKAKPGDPPPNKEELLWNCITVAEVPFLKRIFRKIDTEQGLKKLNLELKEILENEKSIELVDAP